jgi:selenium metabolism protein YedF
MTFVYLNSDTMGSGDPELGRKLLALFLEKLAASDTRVDVLGCINDAVYLTTEGSPVIDSLRALEAKGTRVVSCGTCLDHLQRRERLCIGEIGTMPQTVELLAAADRVIAPC